MDENVDYMSRISTVDSWNSEDHYALLNETRDISECDLNDSTEMNEKHLCPARTSKSVLNKETNRKIYTSYRNTKFKSLGQSTEKTTNRNSTTFALHSESVSKLDFSPSYPKRHNKSCLIFGERLNYKSHLTSTELVTSKCTDKSEGKFPQVYQLNNLYSIVNNKSIQDSTNKTNVYACKTKYYYNSQPVASKSKCDSSTFDRQEHYIPSIDYKKYLKSRINKDIFNTAFTSEDDYEDDLKLEEFYQNKFTNKNVKKDTLNHQPTDAPAADVPTFDQHKETSSDKSNKKFRRKFYFLNFSWMSKKLREANGKLFKKNQRRESLK